MRTRIRNRLPLTKKELQVLSLVAHGYTDSQVAEKMGISQHTVKTHMKRILYKLHSSTRAQAVFNALGEGYFLG